MKRFLVTLTPEEQTQLRELIAKRNGKAEIVKRACRFFTPDTHKLCYRSTVSFTLAPARAD